MIGKVTDDLFPQEVSIYHRYFGDYYQTYDLYITSLSELGELINSISQVNVQSVLGEKYFFIDAYCPYPIPTNKSWATKLFNYLKEYAVFDPNKLKDKMKSKRFRHNITYPIPIQTENVENVRIYYLALDEGNTANWVVEKIKENGLWRPKYTVLHNSVIVVNGRLSQSEHIRALSFDKWLYPSIEELFDDDELSDIRLYAKRYSSGSVYLERSSNNAPSLKHYPFRLYHNYPDLDRAIDFVNGASPEIKQQLREQARELGIDFYVYVLSHVFGIPYNPPNAETRFTREIELILNGIDYSTTSTSSSKAFVGFPYCYPFSGVKTLWYHKRYNVGPNPDGSIPTIYPSSVLGGQIEAGQVIRVNESGLDFSNPELRKRLFYLVGDYAPPPTPSFKLVASTAPSRLVVAHYIYYPPKEITRTLLFDYNEESSENFVPNFDDEFFSKYYHCVIYANNNPWGFNLNRESGTIGRLPGFYRNKDRIPSSINELILAPDLGERSINHSWGNYLDKTGFLEGIIEDNSREVTYTFGNYYTLYGPCITSFAVFVRSKTVKDMIIDKITSTRSLFDIRTIVERYELYKNRPEIDFLVKADNPLELIDDYYLAQTVIENNIELENYVMPDSIRVKEMHAYTTAIHDALNATAMAYKEDDDGIPNRNNKRVTNLAWHILQLCRWNGINVSGNDKNMFVEDGEDKSPFIVIDSSKGADLKGDYGYGALGFTSQTKDGKIEKTNSESQDYALPRMYYKIKSSSFAEDSFKEVTIKSGDYVVCHTIQQLLQVIMQDFDKALDMANISAGVVPAAYDNENLCKYEGLASAIAEILYMNSSISANTTQTNISSVITQGIVLEILKSTGFPLTIKTIPVDIGSDGEFATVPYPSLADNSPNHYLLFTSLMQTLQPIVASVLERMNIEESTNAT